MTYRNYYELVPHEVYFIANINPLLLLPSQRFQILGGVYKGQGHITGGLLNHDPYKAFLVKTETNNCNGLSPP